MEQTDAAFDLIAKEAGDLDVLVNCAWGGYERMVEDGKFTWGLPFWSSGSSLGQHGWTPVSAPPSLARRTPPG